MDESQVWFEVQVTTDGRRQPLSDQYLDELAVMAASKMRRLIGAKNGAIPPDRGDFLIGVGYDSRIPPNNLTDGWIQLGLKNKTFRLQFSSNEMLAIATAIKDLLNKKVGRVGSIEVRYF